MNVNIVYSVVQSDPGLVRVPGGARILLLLGGVALAAPLGLVLVLEAVTGSQRTLGRGL